MPLPHNQRQHRQAELLRHTYKYKEHFWQKVTAIACCASTILSLGTIIYLARQKNLMYVRATDARRQAVFAKQFEYCQNLVLKSAQLNSEVKFLKPANLKVALDEFVKLAKEASYVMPEKTNQHLLKVFLAAQGIILEPAIRKLHSLPDLEAMGGGERGTFVTKHSESRIEPDAFIPSDALPKIDPKWVSDARNGLKVTALILEQDYASRTRQAVEELAAACTLNLDLPDFEVRSVTSRYHIQQLDTRNFCLTAQEQC